MSQLLDVLLDDCRRMLDQRAKLAPVVPPSRADRIIAEGERKRTAYRALNPNADAAMVYGAQIGHLHGEVRRLCNEAEELVIRRNPHLRYEPMGLDELGDVWVGFTYRPGEDSRTWGPPELCYEGWPEELELCEVWVNGREICAALSEAITGRISSSLLERVRLLDAKGRELEGDEA